MIYIVSKSMDPYITMGITIVITMALGAYAIVKVYRNRTHTPSINVGGLLDAIIPKVK